MTMTSVSGIRKSCTVSTIHDSGESSRAPRMSIDFLGGVAARGSEAAEYLFGNVAARGSEAAEYLFGNVAARGSEAAEYLFGNVAARGSEAAEYFFKQAFYLCRSNCLPPRAQVCAGWEPV